MKQNNDTKSNKTKESAGTIEYMMYEGAPIFKEDIKKSTKHRKKK